MVPGMEVDTEAEVTWETTNRGREAAPCAALAPEVSGMELAAAHITEVGCEGGSRRQGRWQESFVFRVKWQEINIKLFEFKSFHFLILMYLIDFSYNNPIFFQNLK